MGSIVTLQSGARLGPYEIARPLGAGGMGEVYRAIDTRLARSVAIKVLPEGVAAQPERSARFEREARAISSLTHPNICQLFDVGSDQGISYLVMEYLDGESLALRLMNGPLPLSELLRIGSEISAALGCAHAQNVIHRDVKPSNIMLTRTGARLLDFGLATDDPATTGTESLSHLTAEGSILGTLAYMAPEQIEGKRADHRSDIWGLGAVLYEMSTGRRPFEAPSRGDLMAAILTRDPDLERITNPALRQLVRKCLARDPRDRWQSASDVADQLRWLGENPAPSSPRTRSAVSIPIALLVVLLLAALAGWAVWRDAPPAPAQKLSVTFPPASYYASEGIGLTISPDGRRVVFRVQRESPARSGPARTEIYSRLIEDFQPALIKATVSSASDFAFSPDGQWLAYTNFGKLVRIAWSGGTEADLASLPFNSRGTSWGPDGTIYFAMFAGGISAVSQEGTDLRTITTPDAAADENSHRLPHVLPGGKHLLFTIRTGRITSFDDARIAVLSLETGRWRTVLEGGSHPTYLSTGHLAFIRKNSLYVVPFDLKSLNVKGSPVVMVEGVMSDTSTGVGQYAVASKSGTLVYVPGSARAERSEFRRVDRQGVVTGMWSIPRVVDRFRVSPDGKKIALQASGANDDIYSYDFEREVMTRVTSQSGDEFAPSWSRDGSHVIFRRREGIYRQALDGSPAELLFEGESAAGFASLSPDGRSLAFSAHSSSGGVDIRILKIGANEFVPLLSSSFDELSPEFSPDGSRIAYVSTESGRPEVYVRSLSGSGRLQVSAAGGVSPRWSNDGQAIYYRFGDEFFKVAVMPGAAQSIGRPELMFRMAEAKDWDVIGDEFLIVGPSLQPLLASGINIIPDWLREVKARVPSR
jgi:eukaryotic-like serine/threonine-protein kinase